MYTNFRSPSSSNLDRLTRLNQPLSLERIREVAPSVFAERPWEGVSDRYTFIPTSQVLEGLLAEGWQVMKAGEQRTIIEGKKGFTKHLLRLRRVGETLKAVDDVLPEIVLINSHDRGSAYQMHAGMFRLVCLNGLVVADRTFQKLSIRHSGRILDDVKKGADQIVYEVPRLLGEVQGMEAITLSQNERGIFARAAAQLRFDETIPIDPAKLLTPKRYGDEKPDLWTTLNVTQENITKGGLRYNQPARTDENGYHPATRRHTREVKSIQEDTKLNKALWLLAEEMKKLKTA